MRPLEAVLALVCVLSPLFAGTTEKQQSLMKLFGDGKYREFVDSAIAAYGPTGAPDQVAEVMGRAYVAMGRFSDAVVVLERVLSHRDSNPGWVTAWAWRTLGEAFYMTGRTAEAKKRLDSAIASNATKNVVNDARGFEALVGMNDYYRDWKVVETPGLILHFRPDTRVENTAAFARERQAAFDSMQTFFHAELPKKIDIFVWNDTIEIPESRTGTGGFAKPPLPLVHTRDFQTPGHEIAHIVSHYAVESRAKTALINEGTAVCFDMTSRDKLKTAVDAAKGGDVSVRKLWESDRDFRAAGDELTYPVAGAFVEQLIKAGGRDTFLQFLPDQTYAHAQAVYGDELGRIIAGFEEKLRPQKK